MGPAVVSPRWSPPRPDAAPGPLGVVTRRGPPMQRQMRRRRLASCQAAWYRCLKLPDTLGLERQIRRGSSLVLIRSDPDGAGLTGERMTVEWFLTSRCVPISGRRGGGGSGRAERPSPSDRAGPSGARPPGSSGQPSGGAGPSNPDDPGIADKPHRRHAGGCGFGGALRRDRLHRAPAQFELRLPTSTYQGRHLQTGCGGNCGAVSIGVSLATDVSNALTSNTFAVSSNDEGQVSTGRCDVCGRRGRGQPAASPVRLSRRPQTTP